MIHRGKKKASKIFKLSHLTFILRNVHLKHLIGLEMKTYNFVQCRISMVK